MRVSMRSLFLVPILIAAGILTSACASGGNRVSDVGLQASGEPSSGCPRGEQGRAIDRIELPVESIANVHKNTSDWVDRPTVVLVNRFTDPRCQR